MATKILILIVLLVFAFALSAAEVALYSITGSGERIKGRISSRIYGSPQRLLSTILVSNSIAVFLFTLIGASLAVDLSARFSFDRTLAIGLEVVVVSGLLILFADSVPKIVAARNPRLIAAVCLPLMAVLLVVTSPIVYPFNSFLSGITARRRKPVLTIDSQGLKTLSNIAGSVGVIDKNEADLLGKISFLGEKNVRDTMTPRTEMVSVQDTNRFEDVVEIFRKSGHSRLPVYSGSPDNIVGMLYARDVLPVLRKKTAMKKFSVKALMRKPVFVPETQSLEGLLETYRANKLHIAVVVDEFGGLAGIVTLSDVVREIFGSSAAMPRKGTLVNKMTDGSLAVKGNARLEEISSDVGGFDFDFEPGDTISSLLIRRHESVPRVGSRLKIGNFEFDVEQATPKTVLQVRLRQLYSGSVREIE